MIVQFAAISFPQVFLFWVKFFFHIQIFVEVVQRKYPSVVYCFPFNLPNIDTYMMKDTWELWRFKNYRKNHLWHGLMILWQIIGNRDGTLEYIKGSHCKTETTGKGPSIIFDIGKRKKTKNWNGHTMFAFGRTLRNCFNQSTFHTRL